MGVAALDGSGVLREVCGKGRLGSEGCGCGEYDG